tara:strand:+ start:5696 stop:6043 length:348 start_codon:yes stop_codon:yes gene_type:complete
MPANTFQTLAEHWNPDVKFKKEKDDATPVELNLSLSEESAADILQTYKDLFPMMVLSAPHVFMDQGPSGQGGGPVMMTPEELMAHMQEQRKAQGKKELTDEEKAEIENKMKGAYL